MAAGPNEQLAGPTNTTAGPESTTAGPEDAVARTENSAPFGRCMGSKCCARERGGVSHRLWREQEAGRCVQFE